MRKNIELEDIPGVGPETAKKLREAGYPTVEAVAVASLDEIAAVVGMSEGVAVRIIQVARKLTDIGGFRSSLDLVPRRRIVKKITTGCDCLDELLGGGIETQSLTEIYGDRGSGRTLLCTQLMVTAQLSDENASVVVIDTENGFRPEKIEKIAERFGLDRNEVLRNIYVAQAYNSNHQMLLVDHAKDLAEKLKGEGKPVRLVVVDSLMSHFKFEYADRSKIADRQQRLNRHLHDLRRLAELYNAAVVFTNYKDSGNKRASFGGQLVSHAADFRLYLRFATRDDLRVVELLDSPHLPPGETRIRIADDGVRCA